MRHAVLLSVIVLFAAGTGTGAAGEAVFPGADRTTPSRAQYFSWINNTNEGATEAQTLINLDFFAWLRDEYGMQLDIYAWDAGNLDGAGGYGTTDSERFRANYPRGWKPIADRAAELGCRLGLWGGPDGFGTTDAQAQARLDTMVGLCRDYHLMLFKFDGVCGTLRPEKQDWFVRMMTECRTFSPDLILLNHRLKLGKGMPYATTYLWEGAETYIDVHMVNRGTATHHRAGALARGLPPDLERLTEDHGVCISSCLDAWDDDLVLQGFNRSLILAPEIYGNPWFLRDDEYAKLARLYNLHRRYGDLLVNGMVLPKADYGANAVARGDAGTRLITLRNLTWEPVTYQVRLDESIGLTATGEVEVRRFHPLERVLGRYAHGATVAVEVPPFRACLLLATVKPSAEIGVAGGEAEVVRDLPGKPVKLRLRGLPGTTATVTLQNGGRTFTTATIDGQPLAGFAAGQPTAVAFAGTALTKPWHRKLADLAAAPVPADAEALYEATCFAADNDALEARAVRRSGPTAIPAVQKARDAFFAQDLFRKRGCWDKVLFDGNLADGFADAGDAFHGGKGDGLAGPAQLRLDLGAPTVVERLVITIARGATASPARVSADLRTWTGVPTTVTERALTIVPPAGQALRYLRLDLDTLVPTEVEGFAGGRPLARDRWRASNRFPAYADRTATAAWSATVTIDEAAPGSYLCIALDGPCGRDGAWVAARCDGRLLGCPDRAVSFDSNAWEFAGGLRRADRDYTYYLPVTPEMIGKPLDVVSLTLTGGTNGYKPSLWLTSLDPYVAREVELK